MTAIGPVERFDLPLAELTTLRLGGRARRIVDATREEHVVEAVARADAAGEPVLVLGGGSNLVIADAGFDGTVVRMLTRGLAADMDGERPRLLVAAGEPWDEVVTRSVTAGMAGIECLSGIPGLTGATPIQNVGAYGQQVSDAISSLRAYDRAAGAVVELAGAECGFGYRTSRFRRSARHVLLEVTFALEPSSVSLPIRYPELARALAAQPGARCPLPAVREAVLALRRRKGMVIDPGDPDSVSAGSFFINPILSGAQFAALVDRASERLGEPVQPPAWPEADGRVKTSAAWLIERAGFHRGYRAGRVGVSDKHTLALVNRGGASTSELLTLARRLRDGVDDAFGVALRPEPTLVGVEL